MLPWALASLVQTSGAPLEAANHVPGLASAAAADGSSFRIARTSAIVGMRSAGSCSAAGRPRVARPNAAKTNKSKPNTPPPNERAVRERSPRPNPLARPTLRPRVVTQQNFFSLPLCDRPGCHEHPQASLRNPAKYCSHECRQAVRNVLDRERKWKARGTLDGRKKRALEYRETRQRREASRGRAPLGSAPRAPPAS